MKVAAFVSGLDKSQAHKIEFQFKKLSRKQKKVYIEQGLEKFIDIAIPKHEVQQ